MSKWRNTFFFFSSRWGSPGCRGLFVIEVNLSIAGIGPQKCRSSIVWTCQQTASVCETVYFPACFFFFQAGRNLLSSTLTWNGVAALMWCPTPTWCFPCRVAQQGWCRWQLRFGSRSSREHGRSECLTHPSSTRKLFSQLGATIKDIKLGNR